MPKKPTGNPTGRPRAQVNKEEFEACCRILCTETEICDIFGICEDTLNAWCKRTYGCTFSDTYKKFSAGGKKSLRRYQFEMAEHNASMAIWLGKQWLGQTDEVKIDNGNNELLGALTDLARKQMRDD